MNRVNRVFVVILLLVAMVVCSVTLVFPVRVLDAVAQQPAALANYLRGFERFSPGWFVRAGLGGLFALTLDIILVLFLIAEVRRPTPKFVQVEKATGGKVLVSIASIADRLRYEVDALANVLRAKPKVSAKRKGVVVELEVETAAGVDVPVKAEQIMETARQVVEESMGLKLARPPKVNLRAVPYPKMPSAPAESRLATPPAPIESEELSSLQPEED
ncbi:MAG: alkaline shock response membrane anchor protein AmaP [Chloroflexi bacterium]|nr:alkaline shock response membrane anchor protein AmaP [Chloroflexota bacterium]